MSKQTLGSLTTHVLNRNHNRKEMGIQVMSKKERKNFVIGYFLISLTLSLPCSLKVPGTVLSLVSRKVLIISEQGLSLPQSHYRKKSVHSCGTPALNTSNP